MKKILFLFAILLVSSCTGKNDKKVENDTSLTASELMQKVDSLLEDSANIYIDTEAYTYLNQFADVLMRWKKNPANETQKLLPYVYTSCITSYLLQKKLRPGDYHRYEALEQKMEEIWFKFDVIDDGNLFSFILNTNIAPREDNDLEYLPLVFIIDFDKKTKACQYIYVIPPREYDSTLLKAKILFADDNDNKLDSITDFMRNEDDGIMLRADGKYFDGFLKYPHFYTQFELKGGETADAVTRLGCFQKQYREYFRK